MTTQRSAPNTIVLIHGLWMTPRCWEHWIPYYGNTERAPLLFIAGGADNIMPASVNRSNAKHYKSRAITDYYEFAGRSHYTIGEPGGRASPTMA